MPAHQIVHKLTYTIMNKLRLFLRKLSLYLALSLALLPTYSSHAISPQRAFDYASNNILYYEQCAGGSSAKTETTTNAEVELAFPSGLDEGKMGDAINEYIKKTTPDSILLDTGKILVASAKKADVSPFIVIAHAFMESSVGKPGVSTFVDQANNSFGRSAAPNQPQVPGNSKITAYRWSSGKASVDHTASENQKSNTSDISKYIRDVYNEEIKKGDLDAYLERYVSEDPQSQATYKKAFIDVTSELTRSSGGQSSKKSGQGGSTVDPCCDESTAAVSGSVNVSGGTNAEKVFNYLTSKGFSAEQAAGAVGNLMQESGGKTENIATDAVNSSSGAKGMIQWYATRATRLDEIASRMGKDWTDIEVQLYYMGWELGLEDTTTYGGQGPTHTSVGDAMKNAGSVEEATQIWLERYEIPCTPGSCQHEMAIRLPLAEEIFAKYGDGAGSGPSSSTGKGGSACQNNTTPAGDFVYYKQTDPEWQQTGLPIAGSGCGPTSMAMIFATKRDKTITPIDVATYLQSINSWDVQGLQWHGVPKAAEKFGMKSNELGVDWERAKSELKAGKLLMVSGQGGEPFTSGGHLIVARGITDDGKIIIANPAQMTETPESTPYSAPIAGTMNIWSFE